MLRKLGSRKTETGRKLRRGSRIVPKRHQGSNSLMRRKLGSQKTETVRKQRPGQTATRTFLVPRPSRAVTTDRRINSEGTKKVIPTRIRTKTRTSRLSIAEDGSIRSSQPVPKWDWLSRDRSAVVSRSKPNHPSSL